MSLWLIVMLCCVRFSVGVLVMVMNWVVRSCEVVVYFLVVFLMVVVCSCRVMLLLKLCGGVSMRVLSC